MASPPSPLVRWIKAARSASPRSSAARGLSDLATPPFLAARGRSDLAAPMFNGSMAVGPRCPPFSRCDPPVRVGAARRQGTRTAGAERSGGRIQPHSPCSDSDPLGRAGVARWPGARVAARSGRYRLSGGFCFLVFQLFISASEIATCRYNNYFSSGYFDPVLWTTTYSYGSLAAV